MRKLFTNKLSGFTLIELLVVIAIIALLMAILIPALSRAREAGKRAVCMNQIRQLQVGWGNYVDENEDKIPSADIKYSHSLGFPGTTPAAPQGGWYEWPHTWNKTTEPLKGSKIDTHNFLEDIDKPVETDWMHSIACGLIFKYVKDFKVYRCPVGEKGEYVTYTMAHSMNTWVGSGGNKSKPYIVRLKNQIKKTSERIVFLDEGGAGAGAFFISYEGSGSKLTWGDLPPIRHGVGTVFSFADSHVEYRKWTDRHCLDYIQMAKNRVPGWWGSQPGDNCDCDLRWMVQVTWGDIPYSCDTPGRKCEY